MLQCAGLLLAVLATRKPQAAISVGPFGTLSPDQRFALINGDDGAALVRRPTGKLIKLIPERDYNAKFSGDSKRLLTSSPGNVYLWSTETGSLLKKISDPGGQKGLAIDRSGSHIFVWGSEGAFVMEVSTGKRFELETDQRFAGVFFEDGFVYLYRPLNAYTPTGPSLKFTLTGTLLGESDRMNPETTSKSGRFGAHSHHNIVWIFDFKTPGPAKYLPRRRIIRKDAAFFWEGDKLIIPYTGGVDQYDPVTRKFTRYKKPFVNGYVLDAYRHNKLAIWDVATNRLIGAWPQFQRE